MGINNKKILVTGASFGIGRATAVELADRGYSLVLVARSMYELNKLQNKIKEAYPEREVEIYQCDVADAKEVEKVLSQILSNGRLYGIINNAGISHTGLIQDLSIEDWHRVIDTNLSSMFYVTKELVPSMIRAKEGRIVNVSSVWGNVGAAYEVAYSASKGGVNAFSKALAKELAPSGITVNAVAFGCIDTNMNQCYSEEERMSLCEDIPAGRMASPAEAASMIADVLESPSYLTGQIITFDGAWI